MRLRTAVAIITMSALALAGCSDNDDDATTSDDATTTTAAAPVADRGNVDGTLKLGHLAPLTGQLSAISSSVTEPVRLAIEEINAAGGVGGKDVELITADDGTDISVAGTSFDQLVESDKVDALLGPATSPTVLALLDKITSAGVLVCNGSATAEVLSDAPSGGYFFRTAPTDRFQGPALAELVLGEGHSKVGLIVRNDSYGLGLAESTQKALEDSGGSIAGEVVAYDPNGTNFDADVDKIVAAAPDAVIVIGFSDDGAKVLSTMIAKGVGPADIPIYTTDGMQSPALGASIDPANPGVVKGIRGTAPAAAPDGVESPFNATFSALGIPPLFSAYYYDCTILTTLAAVRAGSDDPAKMKDEFAANLSGDTECDTFADCKKALDEGKSIHYRGASSSFDKWNVFEPASGTYDVWAFDDTGDYSAEQGKQITIDS